MHAWTAVEGGLSWVVCHEHTQETQDNNLEHTRDKSLERLWRLGRKPLFDFWILTELLDENLVSS